MQQRAGLRILIILAKLGFPENIYYKWHNLKVEMQNDLLSQHTLQIDLLSQQKSQIEMQNDLQIDLQNE